MEILVTMGAVGSLLRAELATPTTVDEKELARAAFWLAISHDRSVLRCMESPRLDMNFSIHSLLGQSMIKLLHVSSCSICKSIS